MPRRKHSVEDLRLATADLAALLEELAATSNHPRALLIVAAARGIRRRLDAGHEATTITRNPAGGSPRGD